METIGMIQNAIAVDNWWLAASSQQCACSSITSHAEFFGKTSHHQGDSNLLQTRFGTLRLLAFSKTKITFVISEKRFQIINEIQKNMTGQLMTTGRTMWGTKVPTLKVTEASLSYVQCFSYLVSSSINVSIFHITWLDTFWTDLIHLHLYEPQFPCLQKEDWLEPSFIF